MPRYCHKLMVPSSSALAKMVPRLFHLTQLMGAWWPSSVANSRFDLLASSGKRLSMSFVSLSYSLAIYSCLSRSSGVRPSSSSEFAPFSLSPSPRILLSSCCRCADEVPLFLALLAYLLPLSSPNSPGIMELLSSSYSSSSSASSPSISRS